MGVYFGQWGEVALKRDTLQSALQTKLDPFDVNTSTKRFSVDHSSGSLITGDEVEIETADGSTLELVNGHSYPDGKWFINVDQVGGIRLFDSFAKAIEGLTANALTLVAPSEAKNILIRTRNEKFRHVAGIREFENPKITLAKHKDLFKKLPKKKLVFEGDKDDSTLLDESQLKS